MDDFVDFDHLVKACLRGAWNIFVILVSLVNFGDLDVISAEFNFVHLK